MRLAGGKFGETLSFCRNVGSLPQVRQWNFGISARPSLNLSGNLNKSAASGLVAVAWKVHSGIASC
jgi:hypothetical protein